VAKAAGVIAHSAIAGLRVGCSRLFRVSSFHIAPMVSGSVGPSVQSMA